MAINSDRIRAALRPYVAGIADIPEDIFDVLEDAGADPATRELAHTIEAMLALLAASKLSEDALREGLMSVFGVTLSGVGRVVVVPLDAASSVRPLADANQVPQSSGIEHEMVFAL